MASQESGSGGTYAYAQSKIETTDTISAAGAFNTGFTIPANTLKAGVVVRVTFQGVYTTTSTASPLFNMSLQATPSGGAAGDVVPAAGASTTLTVSLTNGAFGGMFVMTCISAGSSGSWEAQGSIYSATVNGAVTTICGINSAVVTVDTTKSQALTLKETATLVGGQTFTLRQALFEII